MAKKVLIAGVQMEPKIKEKKNNLDRAIENHINYIAVNRVGNERGFRFIGMSRIVDYEGKILAEADKDHEKIIYAEVDPEKAANKKTVVIPGKYEMDRMKDRKPEFYRPIIESF